MAAHTDERLKITIAQKKAIRNYYRVEKPRGHKQVKEWFKQIYNVDLPTSTISNILSSKFDRIDQLSSNHDGAKRCRPPKYPDLETALAECISRMKTAGIDLTGAVLLNTAHELWPKIPSYIGQSPPSLSGGWVEKFKTRHGIKLRNLQVEAASTRERVNQAVALASATSSNQPPIIDISPAFNGLDKIYTKAANYRREDIFTMSETELFWRLVPNANTLRENASYPRGALNERITVALATNVDGSKRLPPWIIGHFETQRSFDAPGNDIKSLQVIYSSNVLAWMTASEWRKWLLWFDSLMDHPVLLLISPSGSHEVAFTTLIDQASLRFTTVELLPSNLLFQPMELGIIQNFKAHYRKTLLSFISDFYLQQDIEHHLPEPVFSKSQEFEPFNQGLIQTLYQIEDPHFAINLYIAAYWIQKAWAHDLDFGSIIQAWNRSNLLNSGNTINLLSDVAPISPTSLSTVSVPAVTALANPSSVVSPNIITDIMCLIQSIHSNPASVTFMGDMNESLAVERYIYPMEEMPTETVDDFIELVTAQFYPTSPDLFAGPIYVFPTDRIPRNSIKLLPSFDNQQQDTTSKYMPFMGDINKTSRQNSIASLIEPNFSIQAAPTTTSTNSISALPQQSQIIMPLPTTQLAVKMSPKSNRRKSSPSSAKTASSIMSRNSSLSSTASLSGGVPANSGSTGTTGGNVSSTLLSSINPLSNTSPNTLNPQQPYNLPSPVNLNSSLMAQPLNTSNSVGGNYYNPVNYFGIGSNNSRLVSSGAGSAMSAGGGGGYGAFSFENQQLQHHQQLQPQQPQQGYNTQGFSNFLTSSNTLINSNSAGGSGNTSGPYNTYTTARSANTGLDLNTGGPSTNTNSSNSVSGDNPASTSFLGQNPSVYFPTPNS